MESRFQLTLYISLESLCIVEQCTKLTEFNGSPRQCKLLVTGLQCSFLQGGNTWCLQGIDNFQEAAIRWWHPSWSTMLLRVSSHSWRGHATGRFKPRQKQLQCCQTREPQVTHLCAHCFSHTREQEHELTREPFQLPQLTLPFSTMIDCHMDGQVVICIHVVSSNVDVLPVCYSQVVVQGNSPLATRECSNLALLDPLLFIQVMACGLRGTTT